LQVSDTEAPAARIIADHSPSWLALIANAKDSLWSIDFFRCESILLRSHWVMVVMDVFSRRIVGFGVESANIDGVSACRMFNRAIAGQSACPRDRGGQIGSVRAGFASVH
jgi:transposase InsO family protein